MAKISNMSLAPPFPNITHFISFFINHSECLCLCLCTRQSLCPHLSIYCEARKRKIKYDYNRFSAPLDYLHMNYCNFFFHFLVRRWSPFVIRCETDECISLFFFSVSLFCLNSRIDVTFPPQVFVRWKKQKNHTREKHFTRWRAQTKFRLRQGKKKDKETVWDSFSNMIVMWPLEI